ncbi:hypothetical protein BTR22_19110 [Alkalihalophilus pseudofirmus]|uniref:dUTP diphosphatase n=1 Tax=Alkalihalophilus pseudofirmus TaxID=79885 RepID=UPI000951BE32|nr:hypothetical protein BTR22_19110 [Alkalihalophilus pseudofirmus]
MQLEMLFEMQTELDQRIIADKNLDPSKHLVDKALAIIGEIGEALNEWRGFKFWSTDQMPRADELITELVDCLHFVLSIGIEMKYQAAAIQCVSLKENDFEIDIRRSFLNFTQSVLSFEHYRDSRNYTFMFQYLVDLITEIGFDWEQVIRVYEHKNRINHMRQVQGY